jgi:glycosyltransferase involved in cell wall biosynthesis
MPPLIVFCHLRWDFVLQRPQHLLSRLARHWHVLLVEEPVADDGAPWLERSTPLPNLDVLRPHLPGAGRGFVDDDVPAIATLLRGHLDREPLGDPVVWLYTPMALPLIEGLKARALVYDCMDELSAFRNAPPQLHEREAALLRLADVVFTGGPSLYESKRHRHPNVLCLPSAVDAAHFDPERAMGDVPNRERAEALQRSIERPRLGFYGVIDERLDIGLVDALAVADASWQLVMVGPVVKISPDELPRRPNIHWLGQQRYEVLPQLVAGWDVCLLPFALNESTRHISPTKTLEYMAAGKPVVSTPLHDVVSLYGEDVRIARGSAAFVEACRALLAESPADAAQRRQRMRATVARYSWDRTAEAMQAAIQDVLRAGRR